MIFQRLRTTAAWLLPLLGLFLAFIALREFSPTILVKESTREPLGNAYGIPLILPEDAGPTRIRLEIHNDQNYPSLYYFKADDCLTSLMVNGHPVESHLLPFCNWESGLPLSLEPLLREGKNELEVEISNLDGPSHFSVAIDHRDPKLFLIHLGFILSLGLIAFKIAELLWPGSSVAPPIAALGVALRLLYLFCTPIWLRTYDLTGHLDYINFLNSVGTIPHYNHEGGWIFYHPPLYYFLVTTWLHIGSFIGFTDSARILQAFSFVLSTCILFVILGISRTIEERDGGSANFLRFIGATYIGFIFLTSRVSNDVLVQLISILLILAIITWWGNPTRSNWWRYGIFSGLGIITKYNSVVLAFVGTLGAAVRRDLTRRMRIEFLITHLILVGSISGWFLYRRFFVEGQSTLVGSETFVAPGLRIESTLTHLLVFNPIKILEMPFNDPWSDNSRRQYFWEFMFRSIFFGEYSFPPQLYWIAVMLLATGLLLLLWLARGIWLAYRSRAPLFVPLITIFIGSLLSLVAFRTFSPYSCHQDFRFILYCMVPATYFLCQESKNSSRETRWSNIGSFLMSIFAGLNALFIIRLYLLPH